MSVLGCSALQKNAANLALSTTSISQQFCLQFRTDTGEVALRSKVVQGLNLTCVSGYFPNSFHRGIWWLDTLPPVFTLTVDLISQCAIGRILFVQVARFNSTNLPAQTIRFQQRIQTQQYAEYPGTWGHSNMCGSLPPLFNRLALCWCTVWPM